MQGNASDIIGAQGGPSRENCPQCTIALFDRFGGVSGGPFESLNVGKSVGDSEQNVAANREKVKARSGVKAILSAGQVHGENIYVHRGGEPETDLEVDGYDALITNETVPYRDFKGSENHCDFWKISKHQLEQCGLLPENIVLPTICTSCSTDYFSYRRACRESAGVTGRNCSVIALTEG